MIEDQQGYEIKNICFSGWSTINLKEENSSRNLPTLSVFPQNVKTVSIAPEKR